MNPNHDDHGRFAGGSSAQGRTHAESAALRNSATAARTAHSTAGRTSRAEVLRRADAGVASHHDTVPRMTHPGGNTRPVSAPGPAKSGMSLNAPRGSAWGGK